MRKEILSLGGVRYKTCAVIVMRERNDLVVNRLAAAEEQRLPNMETVYRKKEVWDCERMFARRLRMNANIGVEGTLHGHPVSLVLLEVR